MSLLCQQIIFFLLCLMIIKYTLFYSMLTRVFLVQNTDFKLTWGIRNVHITGFL